jgi:hypothetical protein
MIAACQCGSCGARHVVVLVSGEALSGAERVEAVALAALRDGWLYYHPTSSWACPACVARSDYSGAEYRAAARRMAERVRRALTP